MLTCSKNYEYKCYHNWHVLLPFLYSECSWNRARTWIQQSWWWLSVLLPPAAFYLLWFLMGFGGSRTSLSHFILHLSDTKMSLSLCSLKKLLVVYSTKWKKCIQCRMGLSGYESHLRLRWSWIFDVSATPSSSLE